MLQLLGGVKRRLSRRKGLSKRKTRRGVSKRKTRRGSKRYSKRRHTRRRLGGLDLFGKSPTSAKPAAVNKTKKRIERTSAERKAKRDAFQDKLKLKLGDAYKPPEEYKKELAKKLGTKFISDEEWKNMGPEEKRKIIQERNAMK